MWIKKFLTKLKSKLLKVFGLINYVYEEQNHSFVCSSNKEIKTKLEGKEKAARDENKMKDYYSCSMGGNKKYVDISLLRNEHHEMYLGKINKLAINLLVKKIKIHKKH